MCVMLYDEGMYPSGSAHGMVVKDNPEYASKGLEMREYKFGDTCGVVPDLKPFEKLVSLQKIRKKNGHYDYKSCSVIEPDSIALDHSDDNDWYALAFIEANTEGTIRGIHFGEDDGQPDAPRSADLLNIKATEKFISLTHEKYYEALKEYFGNTIIAMFTDEPMIMGRQHKKGLVPWTEGFLKDFVDGGNHETDLIHLYKDINEDTKQILQKYNKAVNKRLEQAFYKPLSSWCQEHGILLTGHPEKSTDIGLLRNFGIPDQDIFVEQGGRVIVISNNNNSFDNMYEFVSDFSNILQKIGKEDKSIKIYPDNENLRVTHVVKHGKDFHLFTNEGEA